MRFIEYANGKYNLVDCELNFETNNYIQGIYNIHYPVYPRFDLKKYKCLNTNDTIIDINTVVKTKGYFVCYSYNTRFKEITQIRLNEIFNKFDSDINKYSKEIIPNNLLKNL